MKTLGLSLTFVSALTTYIDFSYQILVLPPPSLTPFLQFLLPESYRLRFSNKVQASIPMEEIYSPRTTVLE